MKSSKFWEKSSNLTWTNLIWVLESENGRYTFKLPVFLKKKKVMNMFLKLHRPYRVKLQTLLAYGYTLSLSDQCIQLGIALDQNRSIECTESVDILTNALSYTHWLDNAFINALLNLMWLCCLQLIAKYISDKLSCLYSTKIWISHHFVVYTVQCIVWSMLMHWYAYRILNINALQTSD